MTQSMYTVLVAASWVSFLSRISENWPSPWQLICVLVGCAALYCTVGMFANLRPEQKPEDRPHEPLSAPGTSRWELIAAAVCWYVFFQQISRHLPPGWAELSPLFGLLWLWCTWGLCTHRQSEEKPEDLSTQNGADRGA